MTKAAALHAFFNSFGIPFYTASNVPDDTIFPWGTYEAAFGAFGDEPLSITVNLWYRTTSEKIPNDKAMEISEAIGLGGKAIFCDEGAIFLRRGEPFCQNLSDETDDLIKRRYINITAEFITNN